MFWNLINPGYGPIALNEGVGVLSPGARVAFVGDSYVETGASTQTPAGALLGGKVTWGTATWGMIAAADKRFNIDVFNNASKPYGTVKVDGAQQGVSGEGVTTGDRADRVAYIIARNPQIVVFDMGKNDVSAGTALADIQEAYLLWIDAFIAAGIRVVLVTQPALQTYTTGDAAEIKTEALNAWILSLASRPGVRAVVDYTALDGTVAAGAGYFLADEVHLRPAGMWRRAPALLSALRGLVGPATPAIPTRAENIFPFKSMLGRDGLKSASITGSCGTGLRLINGGGTSTAVASKESAFGTTAVTFTNGTPGTVNCVGHGFAADDEVVFETSGALPTGITAGHRYFVLSAGLTADAYRISASKGGSAVAMSGSPSGSHTQRTGYDTQVLTITPVNDGTQLHTMSYVANGDVLYSAFGSTLSAGDWVRASMTVELNEWDGWVLNINDSITNMPARFSVNQNNGTSNIWTEDNYAAVPETTNTIECLFQVQSGSDRFQTLMGVALKFRSDLGGTGIAKFSNFSFEKLASDPRTVWALS